MLATATAFASPILAVKKRGSNSVKTMHQTTPTSSTSITPTAHYHNKGVKLLSVHSIPSEVAVGNTFHLDGLVFNNSPATITLRTEQVLHSVRFNKDVIPETKAAVASCKARQVILKPGEHS